MFFRSLLQRFAVLSFMSSDSRAFATPSLSAPLSFAEPANARATETPRKRFFAGRLALAALALAALGLGQSAAAQTTSALGQLKTLPAASALPFGTAVDASGNLFISDDSGNIKELTAASQYTTVTTLVTGLFQPRGLAVDAAGNIFVAEGGAGLVKEVLAAGGYTTINTLGSGFSTPVGLALDASGNVFITDIGDNTVKEIVATGGYTTVNTLATISGAWSLGLDAAGNLFVTDIVHAGVTEFLAAGGYTTSNILALGSLVTPLGLAVDSAGNIFISEVSGKVKEILAAGGYTVVNTVGGSFIEPVNVSVDHAGNLFVADFPANKVSEILAGPAVLPATAVASTASASVMFTFTSAGTIGAPLVVTQGVTGLDFTDAGSGTCDAFGPAHFYAVGDVCTVDVNFSPRAPGARYGAIQLATNGGAVIATAYVQGIGTSGLGLFSTGIASNVAIGLGVPRGVTVDAAGNVYLSEQSAGLVVKFPLGAGPKAVLASSINTPSGIAVDGAGNVYFGSIGDNAIYEMAGGVGTPVQIAGGWAPDDALVVDGAGNLFSSDVNTGAIHEIAAGTHTLSVPVPAGIISRAVGMTIDAAGNLYAADFFNNSIVKIAAGTFAPTTLFTGGGLANPDGIAIDAAGNLYVINYSGDSNVIRYAAGTYAATELATNYASGGIAIDATGKLWTLNDQRLSLYDRASTPALGFPTTAVGSSSSPLTRGFENDGNASLTIFNLGVIPPDFLKDAGTTTCALGTFAVAGTCNLGATFAPLSSGPKTSHFDIFDDTLNNAGLLHALTLTGFSLSLTPLTLPNPTIGVAYSQPITAGGGVAPFTYAVTSGALPAGLLLNATTGALTGTPTAAGNFTFTITATDSTPGTPLTVARSYSFTVQPPVLAFSIGSLPAAKIGVAYSQTFNVHTGTAPFTYAITSGSLPAGLTLSSTGLLSGTPTQAGLFNITVTATDSSTGTGAPFSVSLSYPLPVDPPTLVINPAALPDAVVGTLYSQPIVMTGGTAPYTYVLTAGTLPVGLTLGSNGLLSGYAYTGGYFNFTVTATDSSTGLAAPFSLSKTYNLTVTPIPYAFVSPSYISFYPVPVGSTGNAWTVTLNNTSASAMLITGIVLSDPINFKQYSTCGSTLAGYSTCNIVISFTPQSAGNFNGTLSVFDSAQGSPQVVTLQGTGTSNSPTVVVSPTVIPFADQPVGTTGNSWNVNLSNTSAYPLAISSIYLSDAGNFKQTNNCGTTLAPYSTCNILVSFSPQTTGFLSGSLVIVDNATPSTTQTVALNGTGTSAAATVLVSPGNITFANQPVGTTGNPWTVTVSNTSGNPVTIASWVLSDTSNFVLGGSCPTTLPAYSTCNLLVSFRPQAAGLITGTLTVTDSGSPSTQVVTLSGTGIAAAPTVVVSPNNISFPGQAVGTTSSAFTVTVSNTSSVPLNIASWVLSDTTNFVLGGNCPATLAAYTSCSLTVSFKPQTIGYISGTLTITDDSSPSTQVVTLNGNGIPATPTVVVSPSSANFGNVTQGTTAGPKYITVTNQSAFPLTFSSIAIFGSPAFTQTNTCGTSLPAYGSCNILVSFAPTFVGYVQGTLVITDNATTTTQLVSLDGTGTSSTASVIVSPSTANFGSVTQGTTAGPKYITVTNQSANPLTFTGITIYGSPSFTQTNNCGVSLPAYGSCNILVSFTPTALGYVQGTLLLTDSASPSTQSVPLDGTGTSNSPTIVVSPSSADFGNVIQTITSGPKYITVSNQSAFPLTFSSIAISGSASYTQTNNCGVSLPAYGSCTILVYFTPTAVGYVQGTLTLIDNASPSTTQTVALNGTGVSNVQTITFQPITSPVTYGVSPITLFATGGPSGNPVTFSVVSGPGWIGGNVLNITGSGIVVVAANQAGNSTYAAATQVTQSVYVNQATAAIHLVSNSNPVLVQNAVTFTATVTGVTLPTGIVNFYDAAGLIGSSPINGAGVAALTTSSLVVGNHSITAVYMGDANFLVVTSAPVTEVVDDFALVAPGSTTVVTNVNASPGGTAVYTMTLTPVGSPTFLAPVTLTVSGLPAGATYTFSPATIALGAGPTTVTLTIYLPQIAGLTHPAFGPTTDGGALAFGATPATGQGTGHLARTLAPFALAFLLPFVSASRRKRMGRLLSVLLLLAGLSAAVGLTGCGAGVPTQSYDVMVSATSGALTHTTGFTLTVK